MDLRPRPLAVACFGHASLSAYLPRQVRGKIQRRISIDQAEAIAKLQALVRRRRTCRRRRTDDDAQAQLKQVEGTMTAPEETSALIVKIEVAPHGHSIGAAGRDGHPAKPAQGAPSNAERDELARLRRQQCQVRTERDILAKATAWFAAEDDKTLTPSSSS